MSKTRHYDADGFVMRAACVCVDQQETQVLLVSSRRDSQLWIVPGGGVEEGEQPQQAAIREVKEEAGVCGRISRTLGVFENSERRHRTSVYVLIVQELLEEWDESKVFGRRRQWFTLSDAVQELSKHKPIQSSYLSLLQQQSTAMMPNSLPATTGDVDTSQTCSSSSSSSSSGSYIVDSSDYPTSGGTNQYFDGGTDGSDVALVCDVDDQPISPSSIINAQSSPGHPNTSPTSMTNPQSLSPPPSLAVLVESDSKMCL